MNGKAEEIRIRYLYRDLVLRKKIRLPFEGAVKIVGPDCAYHLYSVSDLGKGAKMRAKKKMRQES
jgi:hypothetical protein